MTLPPRFDSTISAQSDSFVRDHLPPREEWPEFHFDLPQLHYPARLNCAVELLDRMVEKGHGARLALRGRDVTLTYAELLAQVNRIAHVLRDDLQLVPGNRVLLRGLNEPLLAACWLAVLKAGGIAVMSLPLQRARELQPIIEQARIRVALCDHGLADELEKARELTPLLQQVVYFNHAQPGAPEALETLLVAKPADFENVATAADDVALIAFTSGSTGTPKGSVHFHRDVLVMCDCFPQAILAPDITDIFCGTPSLAFTYGLGGLLCIPLRYGASAILPGERQTAESLLQTIQDRRATLCFTAPTLLRQMALLASAYDLSSLRCCISAGEALPDATRELWTRATGIDIIDGLGTTELMHIFVSHAPQTLRRGAVGQALPGYRVCILDDSGNPLPLGSVGQLAVQGPTGCLYLGGAQQRQFVRGGWNLTGDACRLDQDGYVYYLGRSDDMIISAGYNIAGAEVEALLLQHPAVLECAVVGCADAARGQIVKAFVVLQPVASASAALAAELQEFVKQRLAPYKYPRAIEFVDALPRTENAKLQRYKLRSSGSAVV